MEDEGSARFVRMLVPLLVLSALGAGIWYFMHDTSGVHREAPPIDTITMLPPPPPPPPPQQRPPEPEKKLDIPKPDEPKPVDAPRPMTINGPAQAGTDAFNIGAGDGGGSLGSGAGLGDSAYSRYMGSALEQAIQQDDDVNRQVFSAEVEVWVSQSGGVTRATILRSSGDAKVDQSLLRAIQSVSLNPPSPGMQFPQRIAVSGRRPV